MKGSNDNWPVAEYYFQIAVFGLVVVAAVAAVGRALMNTINPIHVLHSLLALAADAMPPNSIRYNSNQFEFKFITFFYENNFQIHCLFNWALLKIRFTNKIKLQIKETVVKSSLYLCSHNPLPFSNQCTFGAHTIAPSTVTLVTLQCAHLLEVNK